MYPEPHDDLRAHREWLLSFIRLPPGGTVVDLGCGSGRTWPAAGLTAGRAWTGVARRGPRT